MNIEHFLRKIKNNELSEEEKKLVLHASKEALKFMAKNDIVVSPITFNKFFKAYLKILLENKEIFCDEDIIKLAKSFEEENSDKEFFNKMLSFLLSQTEALSEKLKTHTSFTEKKQEKMQKLAQSIKEEKDVKKLFPLLSELVLEIEDLKKKNEELIFSLKEARKEIEKLKKELLEAKACATIDFLTNVSNRLSFMRALNDLIKDFYKYKHPFCLLLIDIDDFKKINDTYGHLVGDRVLKEVAQTIKLNLRAKDIVGRYGGEEFGVLLVSTHLACARDVAERIRKAVENLNIVEDGKRLKITISGGLAEVKEGDNAQSLIKRADSALYLAKRKGKNRICDELELKVEGGLNEAL